MLDAEIALEGERPPHGEKRITELLSALPGVEDVHVYGGLVVLRYDALQVERATLKKTLTENGVRVAWVKAGQSSPTTDAVESAGG